MRRLLTLAAAALVLAALNGVYSLHRSRTFQLFGEILPRVEADSPVVALTFDDGPTARADSVLDYLRDHKVPATFYVTGEGLAAHPEVARRLVADGHELGNHTYHHRVMIFRSQAYIRHEIERTDALIRRAGYRGVITFRPPYTKKLMGLPYFLERTGRLTVTFDVEPESDAEVARDAYRIFANVTETSRNGSIILLHPWYRTGQPTRIAIPDIVEAMRARGYRFVTVAELQKHAAK